MMEIFTPKIKTSKSPSCEIMHLKAAECFIQREIVDFKSKMKGTALIGWLMKHETQPDRLDEQDFGRHKESHFRRIRCVRQ